MNRLRQTAALDPEVMPAEEILAHIRSIRQGVLASSNWWNWGKKGTPFLDIAVKELRQFPEDNTAPGETCWCLEQKWFWNEGARAKTPRQVINLLNTVNSRNSNFLLNVGPDRSGRIIESSVETLAEVGRIRGGEGVPDGHSNEGAGGKGREVTR
jgi:alpha-L-fucosidase